MPIKAPLSLNSKLFSVRTLCPLTPPPDCHQLQADNLEATVPMATLKSARRRGAVDAAIEACKAGGKKIELKGWAACWSGSTAITPHQCVNEVN